LVNGDRPASDDPFEGINTTWTRLEGGEKVGKLVTKALKEYDFKAPQKSVPLLIDIHHAIESLSPSVWKNRKLIAVKALIKSCAGLTLQLNSDSAYGIASENLKVSFNSVHQSEQEINIKRIGETQLNKVLISNIAYKKTLQLRLGKKLGSPYWLLEKGSLGVFNIKDKTLIGQPETPALSLSIELRINGRTIVFEETINYRINDPVRGEIITPFYTLPQLGINFEKEVNLYPKDSPQTIRLEVTNYGQRFEGEVELCFPNGWTIDQSKKKVNLKERGSSTFVSFQLSPTAKAESGLIGPLVHVNGKTMDKSFSVKEINYVHIPKQYVSQPSEAKLVRLDLTLPDKKVGYIMGAGDLVQTNLQAIGFPVTSIDIESISQEELNEYDTVLVGIRAFNVLESLKYKNQLLFDFAAQGGTLIVQYNTSRRMQTKEILPYSIELSRNRVTDENSRVRILEPKHAALNYPHKITSKDFEGWVQERGLYFANNWDPKITPLLGMNDEGESEKLGSLLVASHGNGTVVYTGLSFFRELPAGVPGAYRLLLNLIAL
jgi:hypothetical protein